MRRALVLGSGGLSGGYDAGVVATLCRELKPSYFHSIYACSVGVYAASFFAANQPQIIEEVWRNQLHGLRLVNPFNVLRRRPILDLGYLHGLFIRPPFALDTCSIMSGSVHLCFVATDRTTGQPSYFSPRSKEEVLPLARASAAVPFIHPAVIVRGRTYIDGCFADPLPVQKALEDGHDEVIVVSNKPSGHLRSIQKLRRLHHRRWSRVEEILAVSHRVRIIRPKAELPLRWNFDSTKSRLNQVVDLGIQDALSFLC